MKTFQVVILGIFGALALVAVFVVATFSSGGGQATVGSVEIWGTVPQSTVTEALDAARQTSEELNGVSYREIPEADFTNTLIEAIAAGSGPDLALLPSGALLSQRDKVIAIPYSSLSRRSFQDSFVEASEVLLTTEGSLGLPFSIDPFVLYWNRSLFSEAGIPRAPRYWDEITDLAPELSQATGQSGTLLQSAVALGEWENVRHAKEILLSLIVGLGNSVIEWNAAGELVAVLGFNADNLPVAPAESALRFYTDFADPVKTVYSWNRSQANSQSAFLAGTLAMYFGPASEAFQLRSRNPNLNFDIASYPTVRGGSIAVPAKLSVFAIPRGSGNVSGAIKAASILSSKAVQEALASETGLSSVRRDVLPNAPDNPYESIFRSAALNAFVFLDPNPTGTDAVFKRMVENIASGRLRTPEAIRGGQEELQALLEMP